MEGKEMAGLIIGGGGSVVAEKLAERLEKSGVTVIELERRERWTGEAKYVFVFNDVETEGVFWGSDARVVYVEVENREPLSVIRDPLKRDSDWREVILWGVYGPGMREEGWLSTVLRQAAKNQNLTLPAPLQKIRLLYVDDAVEVVLRACLMSGTRGKSFNVFGEGITSEDLAVLLMDLAKMTKRHVAQIELPEMSSGEDGNWAETWEELRWKPEVGLKEGLELTLQYFFGKIDEEARKPKRTSKQLSVNSEQKKQKIWEVEVEEIKTEGREIVEESEVLETSNKIQEAEEVGEEVIEEKETEEKISNFQPPISDGAKTEEKKTEVRKVWGRALILSAIVLMVMVVWGGWWLLPVVRAVNLARATERALAEGKTGKLASEWENLAKLARSRLETAGGGNYGELMRLIEEGSATAQGLMETGETAEKVADSIFQDKEISWGTESKNLEAGVEKLWTDSGKLAARMAGDWRWLPAGLGERMGGWRERVVTERERLAEARKLVAYLPDLVGADGRKEYLVLLQNQMELRPTGGFIGSYGILSLERGRLTNFVVSDVYEADGQLKGHVEPPEPIKKYLGEAGYFMRDANWKADFGESAKDIEWFLEKETGRKVDGVIGVNLEVAKALLEVVGGVNVADFGEKITKDNLYEQAEYYSETKFFPGSKQKASFLGGVARQLLEEVKSVSGEKRRRMAEAMLEMLDRREIQVAINDGRVAAVLAEAGWDGGMFFGECAKERCLADYLFPVEANLGVNKANYFIKRQVEVLVEISEMAAARTVKISYENTAKSSSWPGGDYKNYMRVYLPSGVNLAGVKIIDGSSGELVKALTGDDLTVIRSGGKTELGMLLMVPINSKRVVELKYVSPINLAGGDKFSYLCYLQKQSGWGDTGLVTLVSMPGGWQPVQVEPEATVVGGKLLFNRKWDRDIRLGVEISK